MPEKNITIITGQSGVSIKNCIQRLGLDFISLEDFLEKEMSIQFKRFLMLPQKIQYDYWTQAFDRIYNEKLSSTKILTFHSVYYHQSKRELFSPLNIKRIENKLKGRVKMVIVFIDDIYNVYLRLLSSGKMFDHIMQEEKFKKKQAIFQSIFYLISLLHWREMEISTTRILSKILDTDLFVVSTNHPIFMIKRLFEKRLSDLKIFYLSHPISEIRKRSKDILDPFVGELNLICKRIINDKDDRILFFPTSIDEKVLQRKRVAGKDVFLPELGQRWGPPYSEIMTLSPRLNDETINLNPLNPQGYELEENDFYPISKCLEILDKFIHQRQIISRDYSLVEQCKDGVIAIRPYFNGERSDGMIGELNHNFLHMDYDENRKCVVFSCQKDVDKYKIERFLRYFFSNKDDPKIREHKKIWILDEFFLRKHNFRAIESKLKANVVPANFDFTKLETIDDWAADFQGRNEEAFSAIIKTIRKVLKKDEIGDKIKKGNYGNRVIYKFFEEKDFFYKVIDILDHF